MIGYPITLVMRARELREAEWPLDRIADLIQAECGRRPDKSTVHRWVHPDRQDTYTESARRWYRHHRSAHGGAHQGRLGCAHHTALYQEARAEALLDRAGMTMVNVARAMAFDYPDADWTYRRVRELAGRAA